VSCELSSASGGHPEPEPPGKAEWADALAEDADPGPDTRQWTSFLSRMILGALVDEHVLVAGDRGWLRKRRVGALR
jgi:hypothetical protein